MSDPADVTAAAVLELASGGVIIGANAAAATILGVAPSELIGRTVGLSFTSGIHLALWVSGLLLLAGVPIAWFIVRGTTPEAGPVLVEAVTE